MASIRKKSGRNILKNHCRPEEIELRLADFDIAEGDRLILEEWDQEKKSYTGRSVETVVTVVIQTKHQPFWPQDDVDRFGFQIIGFEMLSSSENTSFRPPMGK